MSIVGHASVIGRDLTTRRRNNRAAIRNLTRFVPIPRSKSTQASCRSQVRMRVTRCALMMGRQNCSSQISTTGKGYFRIIFGDEPMQWICSDCLISLDL